MNEDYFKKQAARVRNIASNADPFTKRRLTSPRNTTDESPFADQPHSPQ
jgi:hypothetical protein